VPRRGSTGRIQLKPTQERALAAINEEGSAQLTRGRYEELAGVSRSQAAYDLAELVEAGILERIGGGRSTRYRLARRDRPGQRHWTNERIRSALEEFCGGRTAWPSATAFRHAGRSDLYVAASRYGGIGFWAAELGFARQDGAAPATPSRRPWRPSLRWAGAGALAAVLVSVGGASFQEWQGATAHRVAARGAPSASEVTSESPRTSPDMRRAQTPTRKSQRIRVTRRPASNRVHPNQAAAAPASNNVLAVQRSTPRVPMSAAPSTASGEPPPLPAPRGGGTDAPQPLPSP
jgi:DNA-binding transcriptional ArsR family regulator